jgi:hypothetical protein
MESKYPLLSFTKLLDVKEENNSHQINVIKEEITIFHQHGKILLYSHLPTMSERF